jgi:hypothetical protein
MMISKGQRLPNFIPALPKLKLSFVIGKPALA